MTARRFVRWGAPVLMLAVFSAALFVLHNELAAVRYREVLRQVQAVPSGRLAMAVLLTIFAYAALPGYDLLGLRYIGKRLPTRKVAFGSFIAYGLSQTLGFPLFTGGSVRYRYWSSWGLSTEEIAQALSFANTTFVIGVLATSGLALSLQSSSFAALINIDPVWVRPLGAACLGVVGIYLAWSALRREPIRVAGLEFPVPPLRLSVAQLIVAAFDWLLAAAALYALLPTSQVAFWPFVGAFLVAQAVAIVSHVPGGVGVFEAAMVVFLRPELPTDAALGALIAFRAIYYLLPFMLAVALLTATEVARLAPRVAPRVAAAAATSASAATRWVPILLPQALGAATFVAGVVLLVSGVLPAAHGRVAALGAVLPLGVIELSHFLASLAGAGLIVLAWGIQRRLDAAYALTIGVLVIGIVASLLKGLGWEEAAVLGLVLTLLVPSRGAFYRKAALMREPLEPGWVIAVVTVVGAATWLGFFSYKHVEYSSDLFWRFTQRDDAPRFLRATVGVVGGLFVFGIARLMRHARAEPALPTSADLDRAVTIGQASGRAMSNLVLVGDKALLFSDSGNAFLMYGVEGRSWVAMGDPLGPAAEREELAWRFRELADEHGAWTVFYEVGAENLPLYVDLGLSVLKIGEEAMVDLTTFSLEGPERRGLRQTQRVLARDGATFEVVPPEQVPALVPQLAEISDTWLAEKRTREKGFSLGRFDTDYVARFPVAIARAEGRIVAFANVWRGGNSEMSADLMRSVPDAPRSITEYLFIETMLWARAQGYRRFLLGMAPLSGLDSHALAPRWARFGAMLYRHGSQFYNFQGLRSFKDKFDPVWEPRYLASPGGLAFPRILANITTLIAGGWRGVVSK